jgi:ribonucleoside-diphosphate reductase alpha chain
MVMLERYAQKDVKLETLKVNDFVVATIKDDIKFPTLGTGIVTKITPRNVIVKIDNEYLAQIDSNLKQLIKGHIKVPKHAISKPLEIYYEQIAQRVGAALAKSENPI